MHITINRRKLLWVLSSVVDLVGVTDLFHGKRVAYIADTIRKNVEKFPWDQNDTIIAGLLHDIGVSSTDMHEHLVMEMEWSMADLHCERGAKLIRSYDKIKHLAPAIMMHHSRWSRMEDGENELLANLLFLADRVDVLAATSKGDILKAREQILNTIVSNEETLFSPVLVQAFKEVSQRDFFWLKWKESFSEHIQYEWLSGGVEEDIEFDELKQLFTLFSSCVDGKSPYTYNHSVGVAQLAKYLATLLHCTEDQIQNIELSGLMHDLGKLRIPDKILDKPGSLDDDELLTMRHHSYDTFSILSQIPGLEKITQWASQHHEKLNGKGYPEGTYANSLTLESRILTVADIFQALAQDRPYREGLSLAVILSILEDMVHKNEIDSTLVDLIKENGPNCMAIALSGATISPQFP